MDHPTVGIVYSISPTLAAGHSIAKNQEILDSAISIYE